MRKVAKGVAEGKKKEHYLFVLVCPYKIVYTKTISAFLLVVQKFPFFLPHGYLLP